MELKQRVDFIGIQTAADLEEFLFLRIPIQEKEEIAQFEQIKFSSLKTSINVTNSSLKINLFTF